MQKSTQTTKFIEKINPDNYSKENLDKLDGEYKQFSEMSQKEREFLNYLVLKKQPKKLLELGVSAGGSSVIILNAIKNIENAHLSSIDYAKEYYKNKNLNVGHLVENYPKLKQKWKLYSGGLALEFMDEIGGDIDFCLIDTAHVCPGEILDFLMVLPYLKDDATLLFHDTNLHCITAKDIQFSEWKFTNNILMSSIHGKKLLQTDFDYEDLNEAHPMLPNIGAIELNKETKERVWEIFNLLSIGWCYMPSDIELLKLKNHFSRFYKNSLIEYFDRTINYQKKYFCFFIDKILKINNNEEKSATKKIKYTFFERIFSVKNSADKRHKVIKIANLKIKIKRNKY